MLHTQLTLKTKLVRLLLKKKWQKTYHFLKTKTGNGQAQLTDTFGLNALSIALANRAPLQIIVLILEIKPSLSKHRDNSGMLPLHMACQCGASAEVISLLLQHDKCTTASAFDSKKKTPLHYSAKYLCDPIDLELSSLGSSVPLSIATGGSTRKTMNTKSRIYSVSPRSATRVNSVQRSDTTENDMSMSKDEFHDQLQTIQTLMSAAPHVLFCVDANRDTPIDIIQECKAEHSEGAKWERADIVCEVMREVCIQLYREQKKIWETCGVASVDASIKLDKNEGGPVIRDEETLFEVNSIDYSFIDISLPSQNEHLSGTGGMI